MTHRFTHIAALALFATAALWAGQVSAQKNNGDIPVNTVDSARRMITDLMTDFPDAYPQGESFLHRLDAIETALDANANDGQAKADLAALVTEAAKANPLLKNAGELLVIRRKGTADRPDYTTNAVIRINGWDNDISRLSDIAGDVEQSVVYKHPDGSVMKHIMLSYDAKRLMFSGKGETGRWGVMEVGLQGEELIELTPTDQPDVHWFDSCYLPNSDEIIVCSTAGMQGLPCVNGSQPMANLYKVNTKTGKVRQLTFEQDSDWYPRVLNNGRVMYLRWEYTDTPHYFTRVLFHMNPDGTQQLELWGSGSYFPTAFIWPRAVPGSVDRVIGVVSGHHSANERGRLMLIDRSLGRKYPMRHRPEDKIWGPENSVINIETETYPAEVTGCVQEIPGWGRDVVGNVRDGQADGMKYVFKQPYPLSDKYFLVSMRGAPGQGGKWAIALVDVFDNMTVLYEDKDYDCFEPTPIMPRELPQALVDRTIPGADATFFCTDIYGGRGLKGVPRGKVKSLRVFSYHYGYNQRGGHESVGQESSWDIKRILGTVPVEEDGSFCFTAPANTPIAVQPLDEDGAALTLMRSWMVGMPGETLSCNGCHEDLNEATPAKRALAALRPPRQLENWLGEVRPFAYQTDVQPMLDKYCVGCHNDETKAEKGRLSFVAHNTGDWNTDTSYQALNPYVRRPGPEDDYDILVPMEWHASTSELIRMLKAGHNGVELDQESWERLYTWIDMNAPYRGMWDHPQQENRRIELSMLYAGLSDNPEEEHRTSLASLESEKIEPVMPLRQPKPEADNLSAKNFPFTVDQAKQLPGVGETMTLEVGDGLSMKLVRIPAGQYVMGSQAGFPDEAPRTVYTVNKPFWMGETEVTNAQYEAFDPSHDTRYLDEHGKDHAVPGYIANHADQPVARVSWQDAMNFCKWLSEKSGKNVTLPTEAQWEWAARAGSDKQFFYGDRDTDFSRFANLADASRRRTYTAWDGGSKVHVRRDFAENCTYPLRDDRFTDKWFIVDFVKQYDSNPFGLYDIVGNVCEWTRSDYVAYPYTDAANTGDASTQKVARGGSWNDRPKVAGSSARFPYETYQKVYNVGFRVIVEE